MARALYLLFGVLLCQPCLAQVGIDHCALPQQVHTTTSLRDFPPSVAAWTRGMGQRDGPLATDAITLHDNPPPSRLVRAFSRKRRWVVVSELGGFASAQHMSVYAISRDGRITRNLTDNKPVNCRSVLAALEPQPDDF